jgi:hypothetical protein
MQPWDPVAARTPIKTAVTAGPYRIPACRRAPPAARAGELPDPIRYLLSICSTAMKASCGISTLPTCFMRFLPSFCFSRSFFLREMSPP